MRLVKYALLALLVLLVTVFLNFYLPSKDVVRIVGTDVKRMDVVSRDFVEEGDGNTARNTRDVRFVNAVWENGKPRVYRNEETDWGFPWYFKFDSGNVQAKAQNLTSNSENPKWVVVTHYGWRIQIFSMFPNAVDIEQVDGPGYTPIPWFNIVFLIGMGGLIWIVLAFLGRLRARHVDPLVDQFEEETAAYRDAAESGAEEIKQQASGIYGRWQRWLDTWRPKDKKRYPRR